MKTEVDERFRREARDFSLAFTCDACAAFDPARGDCAYGYPTGPHRRQPLDRAREIVFCKAFESV